MDVRLRFSIFELHDVVVESSIRLRSATGVLHPLVLNAHADLHLEQLWLDGDLQDPERVSETLTVLPGFKDTWLRCRTRLNPASNTEREGLFVSDGVLATQCEAEGFRRITCYPDRPDVSAPMTVDIIADRAKYPVLLSNGSLVAKRTLSGKRHMARWRDRHPKPSYLFAIVAGAFDHHVYRHEQIDGSTTTIKVYQQKGSDNPDTSFAASALSNAMTYDEREFGLRYDYPVFRIVALKDSSTGGMENTSLNIFNHRLVAVSPTDNIDDEFVDAESTVAHEYFHHWSGNRVTCRTWLELSLKEGLTVYREQCFSASSLGGRTRRLADIEKILNEQYLEENSPAAHAVRPREALEINNLYTITVYKKSAEIIRMAEYLLGPNKFRRALDRYFSENFAKAVGWDEFLDALRREDDGALSGLEAWLETVGTPRIEVVSCEVGGQLQLTISRLNENDSAGLPLRVVPLRIALVTASGVTPVLSSGTDLVTLRDGSMVMHTEMPDKPWALSVNRGFAAPVEVVQTASVEQMSLVLRYESDPFSRLQARHAMLRHAIDSSTGRLRYDVIDELTNSLQSVIADGSASPGLLSLMLAPPSAKDMPAAGCLTEISDRIALAEQVKHAVGNALRPFIDELVARPCPPDISDAAIDSRRLRLAAMRLLPVSGNAGWLSILRVIAHDGMTLTERYGALSVILDYQENVDEGLLNQFYEEAASRPILLDKWFALQGQIARDDTVERVRRLWSHVQFDWSNYNRTRSLLDAFSKNQIALHRTDCAGYEALVEACLIIDAKDPQLASLLFRPLMSWTCFGEQGRQIAKILETIELTNVSTDLSELFNKVLKDPMS